MSTPSPASRLTDDERRTRIRAREIFSLREDGHCAYTGEDNPVRAAGYVLGWAKDLLRQEEVIIARLDALPPAWPPMTVTSSPGPAS